MANPYNSFVLIPQEFYQQMVSVYYDQSPLPTVTTTDVSSKNDHLKMIDVEGQSDLLTMNVELINNQELGHSNLSSDTHGTNENHIENTSHSVEFNESDSDCIIIGGVIPESSNQVIQNVVKQSDVPESLSPLASRSSASSSSLLSSSMTTEYPNLDCLVRLDRLTRDQLLKFHKSKTIQQFLNSSHLTVDSNVTSVFGLQNQLFPLTTENRQICVNHRERFRSLAKLIEELSEFDFPTNRPLTRDDVNRWCIKKATDIINNCKKKT